MKVCVSRAIDCAHQLIGTEVHGHTYTVTACVSAPVGPEGIAYSVDLLKQQLDYSADRFDHKLLNDVLVLPTAESIAIAVQRDFELNGVEVSVRVQIGNAGYVETE